MNDAPIRELRYAVRGLRRRRFFAAVTVLTLGLGIGVITALFAIVRAVVFQPLVPEQSRVVRVSKRDSQRGGFPLSLSLPEFVAWRDQSRSFEALAAIDLAATGPVAVGLDYQMSAVRLAPVAGEFFRVVNRGAPLHGRWLEPSDDQPGAEAVAVVSERFWRRASGGDPAFVGRRLSWAGDRTLRVVGVAPSTVDYPLDTDIWAPAATVFDGQAGRFDARNPTFSQFELLGRLRSGISADQARAELTVIHQRLLTEFSNDDTRVLVVVEPLLDSIVGDSRRVLFAVFGAAALVFIVAGVNVAALLLMRASGRRAEMAVRIALGASRAHLLRQTVAEALVLGMCAALCGLAVAQGILSAALWLVPADVPRMEQATLDLRVLGFSAIAALAWVMTLGIVPAWGQSRVARSAGLEHAFRGVQGTRGLRVFTMAQVAAAVVVAIGAGLLVRTFVHLQAIDRGFNSDNVLMISLLLPDARHRDARTMLAFYDQLLPQVEALPGVLSASPTHVGPGSGALGLSAPMRFEGQTPEEARTNPWATWEPVMPSYFRTLGIRIVGGRGFTDADRRDTTPVAIVSQSVAQRYWPGQDILGKRLQFVAGADWPWVRVVGVAADTRYRELTKSWMTVYFPADQFFFFQPASLLVRTTSRPDAVVPAIVQRVHMLEPAATVATVSSMNALLARELARPLTSLTVIGLFALIAMVLAAVGVYGVVAYEIRQRRRELAVRLAVGATAAGIFRSVMRRSLTVAGVGAMAGMAVAMSVMQSLNALLYGVQPVDPIVFATVTVLLVGVVLVATFFPARQAGRIDPASALRAD